MDLANTHLLARRKGSGKRKSVSEKNRRKSYVYPLPRCAEFSRNLCAITTMIIANQRDDLKLPITILSPCFIPAFEFVIFTKGNFGTIILNGRSRRNLVDLHDG